MARHHDHSPYDCETCKMLQKSPRYANQSFPQFEPIEASNIDTLKKRNWELTTKLEAAQQAPKLLKNMFAELETAEGRVKELQKALDESKSKGNDSKEKYQEVQKATSGISDLKRRLDIANRKNAALQRKVRDRQQLEAKLKKAAADMEKVKSEINLATKRSTELEQELDEARKKESELKSVNLKLRLMQTDLDNANSKLQNLEKSLDIANKKWMQKPRDHIEVDVKRGGSHLESSHYDMKGRHIDDTIKIKSLDYIPPRDKKVKPGIAASKIRPGDNLRFAIGDLEKRSASFEKTNQSILNENDKLAKEIQIMQQAMDRLGYTITKEPVTAGGSGLRR